ncbi:SNF2 family N-terminal domain-containing protein [Schizophyllum commune]
MPYGHSTTRLEEEWERRQKQEQMSAEAWGRPRDQSPYAEYTQATSPSSRHPYSPAEGSAYSRHSPPIPPPVHAGIKRKTLDGTPSDAGRADVSSQSSYYRERSIPQPPIPPVPSASVPRPNDKGKEREAPQRTLKLPPPPPSLLRGPDSVTSDSDTEESLNEQGKRAIKRRKVDEFDAPPLPPMDESASASPAPSRLNVGRAKAAPRPPAPVMESVSAPVPPPAKPPRKRAAPRKKRGSAVTTPQPHETYNHTAVPPVPPATAGYPTADVDDARSLSTATSPPPLPVPHHPYYRPSVMEKAALEAAAAATAPPAPSIALDSRPASPSTQSTAGAFIYELDDVPPTLRKAKKVDQNGQIKRVRTVEEAQKKVWTTIARRDVVKVYKYQVQGYQQRQSQLERLATLASRQARKPFTKTPKSTKDAQTRAKRLMREMMGFWKKNEKEERDVRRREQKEAVDRMKVEDEKREAARQARKLEFLISQTELYSHFVGNKIKTDEIERSEGQEGQPNADYVPTGATLQSVGADQLREIDFDDEDTTNLHQTARHNAEQAIAAAKERAAEFDKQAGRQPFNGSRAQSGEKEDVETGGEGGLTEQLDDELNFNDPTTLDGPMLVQQPKYLTTPLKDYQLKGLNWLATLYEQGINGILADEMGLGKTIQSISLLAYLAEKHNIWGPFLVVAPASTLHNWDAELTRFVPKLKAKPYWGQVKDRATMRKYWSKKDLTYDEDTDHHIIVTSYQMILQDQQYFQRVKWQYMILDEAQNIKNSASARWKVLLGLQCRNRLLLTGTPIQNSMQELWALLHFIMPSLFDSHDEFNEWFSKDIESGVGKKGGNRLNEHQLRRLHMILKPFMLRRLKKHVQMELGEKIEKDVYVEMSGRQGIQYWDTVKSVSKSDVKSALAPSTGQESSYRYLYNIIMHLRKIINHPELMGRTAVQMPFSFSPCRPPVSFAREADTLMVPYSARNLIEYTVPNLLWQDGGFLSLPHEESKAPSRSSVLTKLMNIWSTDWIEKSLAEDAAHSFSFLRLMGLTSSDAHRISESSLLYRRLLGLQQERKIIEDGPYSTDPDFVACTAQPRLRFNLYNPVHDLEVAHGEPALTEISRTSWATSVLSLPSVRFYRPAAVAPPVSVHCNDRAFLDARNNWLEAPFETIVLYGLPPALRQSERACALYEDRIPALPPTGLLSMTHRSQIPPTFIHTPAANRLIYDSGKLSGLDTLLQQLKADGHRVLLYSQMTKLMDILEEYLIYRQYKYLRLDGSCKVETRRDLVNDWQTKPEYFVFLLSTKAGGVGINLTAADTVVFYDHDWNPSNDAQAMDRAHRLGQTRQVTVYRLICRNTVDERVLKMARRKKDVQDVVVGNKSFAEAIKANEVVELLLGDENVDNLGDTGKRISFQNDDDDEFGQSGPAKGEGEADDEDTNGTPVPSTSGRGRGRGRGRGSRGGGRGGAPGRRGRKKPSDD